MALPNTFSEPRVDAHGDRYVVHIPSGVHYYIREERTRGAKVTTYTRSSEARPHQDCPLVRLRIACYACGYPASESMYDSVEEYQKRTGLAAPSPRPRPVDRAATRPARPVDNTLARATFIEGSAP